MKYYLNKKLLQVLIICFFIFHPIQGQGDGFIIKDGKSVFPIGFYNLPKDDAALKEMADAGVNLVRCRDKSDLDNVLKAGIQGWISLPLDKGKTKNLENLVNSVAGHPALAVWEGPDEIVWSFTEDVRLHKMGRWGDQTPEIVQYAQKESSMIMPRIREAVSYIRSVDPYNLQVWINEAISEPLYVRQYLDIIDITGMDYYPIITKTNNDKYFPWRATRDIKRVGFFTDRWKEIGRGKPVWMVLQAFSYNDLGGDWSKEPALPSFYESRFMAYVAITHGARGILYYGSGRQSSEVFRQSLYSLTSELSMIQPFLISQEQKQIKVYVIKDWEPRDQTISWTARQFGREWIIVLVNETELPQRGVVVSGMQHLNNLKFAELYGEKEVYVENEEFMTSMKPYEVKVFATSRKLETKRVDGRTYAGVPEQSPR